MPVTNEIIVVVGKEKVRATSKGGAVGHGKLRMDQLRLATINVFEELLLNDAIQSRRHMEVLGQHLYEAIFDTEIDALMNEKLVEVKQDRLRLQLQFESDVDADIARLPWEFLYSPVRQDFLATDVNLVLSRYMELRKDRELLDQAEGPLRALVVVSRPNDERTVLAKDVIAKIKELGEVVQLEVVDPPTLDKIENALRVHTPHIFHFIGHGQYDSRNKTGFLLLVNPETGGSETCDDATLIDRFKAAQCFPRLVFLHMCEGGITEKNATVLQAFSGFAPKLIHAKIPSVVAMQYPIKNESARDFSVAFYTTLAEGGSVDEAVQQGRSKIDLPRRSRLFGTPALYMHSAEGLVLPRPKEKKPLPSDEQHNLKTIAEVDPAAGNTAPSAPIEPNTLERVFAMGIDAAKSIPEQQNRMKVTQNLFRMKAGLATKTSAEIFNVILLAWETETEPSVKGVWEKMMQGL